MNQKAKGQIAWLEDRLTTFDREIENAKFELDKAIKNKEKAKQIKKELEEFLILFPNEIEDSGMIVDELFTFEVKGGVKFRKTSTISICSSNNGTFYYSFMLENVTVLFKSDNIWLFDNGNSNSILLNFLNDDKVIYNAQHQETIEKLIIEYYHDFDNDVKGLTLVDYDCGFLKKNKCLVPFLKSLDQSRLFL